jgi:uncharacterized protein YjbJ (UPF0337 family)
MTGKNVDKAKGRVKEAAGAVTGDSSIKNKGPRLSLDRKAGRASELRAASPGFGSS